MCIRDRPKPDWYSVRLIQEVMEQPVSPVDLNIDLSKILRLSLIHISEPTRLLSISYAVFCLKKKKKKIKTI